PPALLLLRRRWIEPHERPLARPRPDHAAPLQLRVRPLHTPRAHAQRDRELPCSRQPRAGGQPPHHHALPQLLDDQVRHRLAAARREAPGEPLDDRVSGIRHTLLQWLRCPLRTGPLPCLPTCPGIGRRARSGGSAHNARSRRRSSVNTPAAGPSAPRPPFHPSRPSAPPVVISAPTDSAACSSRAICFQRSISSAHSPARRIRSSVSGDVLCATLDPTRSRLT